MPAQACKRAPQSLLLFCLPQHLTLRCAEAPVCSWASHCACLCTGPDHGLQGAEESVGGGFRARPLCFTPAPGGSDAKAASRHTAFNYAGKKKPKAARPKSKGEALQASRSNTEFHAKISACRRG